MSLSSDNNNKDKALKNLSEIEIEKQNLDIKKVREKILQGGKKPLAHIRTYGCQQNVNDGEKIKGMVEKMGYTLINGPENADLVIYNTCAIRENAEDRVFGNLGALKHPKRRKKDMLIGLCGCMAQQEHIVTKIKKSYSHVDMVFGTQVLHTLPSIINKAMEENGVVVDISQNDSDIIEGMPIKREGNIKAWVPIMYGCNNFCTYCVVPLVRGRERSRSSEEIVLECKQLIKDGYKEITLLGQNVNSYGKGLDEDINFPKLLEKLNAIDGDFWIRFMTSHPRDATTELIDTMAKCDKVCNHFHLPVQSGSDRILKLMNRHYDVNQYLSLVDYAREKIDSILFTSDIIVGFPGEQYEDFKGTIDLIKRVKFDALFTYIYSKRVGTKASEMDDDVLDSEKSKWFTELLETQSTLSDGKLNGYIGKTIKILVDGKGRTDSTLLTGKSSENLIIDFAGDDSLIGQFVDVKIVSSLDWALIGEINNSKKNI